MPDLSYVVTRESARSALCGGIVARSEVSSAVPRHVS